MEHEGFLRTARQARSLLRHDAVASRWGQPSALTGYTVAGLAGHLGRGILTTHAYLSDTTSGPAFEPVGSPPDAAGYFAQVLGDTDPVDSDLHRSIRKRSLAGAAGGPAQLLVDVDTAVTGLAELLPQLEARQGVRVLDALEMRVEDYLETRIVELVVHMDDLACSIEMDPPEVDRDIMRRVVEILAGVAFVRDGGWPTIRSLARRERQPAPVRAF